MKFYNPTGFKIETMAGGKTYYVEPFSTVEVWDMDHARILIKKDHNCSKQGLVHLEYDDNMQKKFKTFEEFKKDQARQGLKNLHAKVKETWVNERQAEIDIKHHKTGAEADKAIVDPSKFSEKLKMVEEWQAELEAKPTPKIAENIEPSEPKRRKYQRNTRVKNESASVTNQI